MAILGLGTDIIGINRIDKAMRQTPNLAKRILRAIELEQFNQSKKKASFLAKRFAAKEAAAKALGTGIASGISFQHFQINHDQNGKPELIFFEQALSRANQLGIKSIHISMSDELLYACATVILEG